MRMNGFVSNVRLVVAFCLMILILGVPGYAVQVGWSVDIHQNQFRPCADDFHVWGVLESLPDEYGPHPPTIVEQDNLDPFQHYQGQTCYNGIFENFSYQIGGVPNPNLPPPSGYTGPWPPTNPFYYFEANWWSDTNCVEYCQWAHFGLKFDENDKNYGYWLQGRWTAEHGAQYAQENTPIVGFEITDGSNVRLRIQNANPISLGISQVDLLALTPGTNFAIENLTTNYFDVHPEYNWTPVPDKLLPSYIGPSSFFDVFLDSVPGMQNFGGGQILLARQKLTYDTATGTETFWQYEIHESVVPEPSSLVVLITGGVVLVGGLIRRNR